MKVIRLAKAIEGAHNRTNSLDFFYRVNERMPMLNDYRMSERDRRGGKKNKWLKSRELQRAECKMLTLYFFGGLMNKFHTKWKRSDLANLQAARAQQQKAKSAKEGLKRSESQLNPTEYSQEEIARYEAERILLE